MCESCDNYFALEADIYSVSYYFASWTIEEYEDKLKKEEERLRKARAEMEEYWEERRKIDALFNKEDKYN